ncbi:MAG: PorT protein [bacterium P3]|nr:MAG: PorT protein [bacterium P3]KWW42366.1 MAG: PorT protein [bacterium F083]
MHRLRIVITALTALAGIGSTAWSQIGNLMSFDDKLLHYGIRVGLSRSKFDLEFTRDDDIRTAVQGTASYYSEGFHIAVVGDLRVGRYFNLRALPGITLIDRDIYYNWEPGYMAAHPLLERHRSVESVYGDLPLEIKFRAWRWNNFRPYLTGGGSYSFDFSSLRKNKNNNDESIIRLNSNEFRYTVGVGADFFLRYVKFAVELKMAFGINDLHILDNELYTRSIDGMHSRTLMISFTFEG